MNKKTQKSNDIYGLDKNSIPIYRVEEAYPVVYPEEPYTQLPLTVDFQRVIQNIMKSLAFLKDKENNQKNRYEKWQSFLKMTENKMVVSDLFWLTICKFFLKNSNEIDDIYKILEKRIAKNFINFFIRVDDKYEKDDFFKKYFDILSQSVFYSLFYAYPKSRNQFNDDLKHKLIEFFSEKFTGIKISSTFGYYDKWCLDLGAGNIFKIDRQKFCQTAQNFRETENQNMPNIKRVQKLVRYSPIVTQYLTSFNYKTKNYLKEFKLKITEYQDKTQQIFKYQRIDQQFQNYSNRVNMIKQNSKHYVKVNSEQKKELTKQIKLIKRETLTHQHRLEKRKIDELEKGTNEYANYLVSMLNSGINIEPNKNLY